MNHTNTTARRAVKRPECEAMRNLTLVMKAMKPACLVAAMCVLLTMAPNRASAQLVFTNWQQEYAYSLGVQAYLYCFPWLNMAQYRWSAVTQPPSSPTTMSAPLNQFWHATNLMDATYQQGGSPNTDTLYSLAWLDLTKEPVILSVPKMERYYCFEFSCMDSDNLGYVGMRVTGLGAGNYAILGPNWYGILPPGVTAGVKPNELRSRTPYVFVTGRTIVTGTNDLTNVYKLQAQYKLTPLSYWGTTNTPPINTNVFQPFDPKTDPLAEWKTINLAMTENPPDVPNQQPLLDWFADIGIGPGQDVTSVSQAMQVGLIQAGQDAYALMQEEASSGGNLFRTNGWVYPSQFFGRFGQYDDFLNRATFQSLAGIVANDPAEAVYLNTTTDLENQQLWGTNYYTMHFASNCLPDVAAFWSATLYDGNHNLVANQLNRYKLGSLSTPPLTNDPDGGLTIYLQSTPPGDGKDSNWLPTPAEGKFNLILRCYMPGADIVNQTWGPPAIRKLVPQPTYYRLHLQLSDGNANLTWSAAPGLRFQVQQADQVLSNGTASWLVLVNEITSSDANYCVPIDLTAPAKFYRLLQWP